MVFGPIDLYVITSMFFTFFQNPKNETFFVYLPCFIRFLELWYTPVVVEPECIKRLTYIDVEPVSIISLTYIDVEPVISGSGSNLAYISICCTEHCLHVYGVVQSFVLCCLEHWLCLEG